jgi:hypothetical protein
MTDTAQFLADHYAAIGIVTPILFEEWCRAFALCALVVSSTMAVVNGFGWR